MTTAHARLLALLPTPPHDAAAVVTVKAADLRAVLETLGCANCLAVASLATMASNQEWALRRITELERAGLGGHADQQAPGVPGPPNAPSASLFAGRAKRGVEPR